MTTKLRLGIAMAAYCAVTAAACSRLKPSGEAAPKGPGKPLAVQETTSLNVEAATVGPAPSLAATVRQKDSGVVDYAKAGDVPLPEGGKVSCLVPGSHLAATVVFAGQPGVRRLERQAVPGEVSKTRLPLWHVNLYQNVNGFPDDFASLELVEDEWDPYRSRPDYEDGAPPKSFTNAFAMESTAIFRGTSSLDIQLQIKVRGRVKVYVGDSEVGNVSTEVPEGDPVRATLAPGSRLTLRYISAGNSPLYSVGFRTGGTGPFLPMIAGEQIALSAPTDDDDDDDAQPDDKPAFPMAWTTVPGSEAISGCAPDTWADRSDPTWGSAQMLTGSAVVEYREGTVHALESAVAPADAADFMAPLDGKGPIENVAISGTKLSIKVAGAAALAVEWPALMKDAQFPATKGRIIAVSGATVLLALQTEDLVHGWLVSADVVTESQTVRARARVFPEDWVGPITAAMAIGKHAVLRFEERSNPVAVDLAGDRYWDIAPPAETAAVKKRRDFLRGGYWVSRFTQERLLVTRVSDLVKSLGTKNADVETTGVRALELASFEPQRFWMDGLRQIWIDAGGPSLSVLAPSGAPLIAMSPHKGQAYVSDASKIASLKMMSEGTLLMRPTLSRFVGIKRAALHKDAKDVLEMAVTYKSGKQAGARMPRLLLATKKEIDAAEAASKGEDGDKPGTDDDDDDGGTGGGELSFAADVKPILDGKCTGCHNAGNMAGGVNLATLNDVIGVTAALIVEVSGPGGSMPPPGGTRMSAAELRTISDWDAQGRKP